MHVLALPRKKRKNWNQNAHTLTHLNTHIELVTQTHKIKESLFQIWKKIQLLDQSTKKKKKREKKSISVCFPGKFRTMEKFIENLPPMDLMRSEKMTLVQLIIPAESSHRAITYLGELGLLQFRDVSFFFLTQIRLGLFPNLCFCIGIFFVLVAEGMRNGNESLIFLRI